MTTHTLAQVAGLLAWSLAIAVPAGAATGATPPITRVLVLHHYGQELPFRPAFDTAVDEALRRHSDGPVDLYFEEIESYRFPDAARTGVVRDYLAAKFAGRALDVILAVSDTALTFLQENPALFPGVPIVALVTRGSLVAGDSRVTGFQQQVPIGDTLALALQLAPATERVFVIDGALYNTGDIEAEVRRQAAFMHRQLDVVYLRDLPMADLIARVEAIPPRSILLFVRQLLWDRETPLTAGESLSLVAQVSPVPIFSFSSEHVGRGVLGGSVWRIDATAAQMADMAIRIANGVSPRDLAPAQTTSAYMVDWRQLRRWQIAEASLPQGTIVRFREVSTWERHGSTILTAAGIILVQSLLIAGLVLERRRRHHAEIESRRHLAGIAHLDRRAAMGELATSLAHELNQPLNAILQNAGVAGMLLAAHAPPPALAELEDIISDIRKDDIRASEIIRRMRGLLQKHELGSEPVDLNEVAREAIAVVRPDALARGIDVDAQLANDLLPVRGDQVHLQQVLMNLLMNALDAVATQPRERRRVRVSTRRHASDMLLEVADAGTGLPAGRQSQVFEPFYTTKREGTGMGMGLAIARSIVEAHSGRIGAANNEDGGATFCLSLPAGSEAPDAVRHPAPAPLTKVL